MLQSHIVEVDGGVRWSGRPHCRGCRFIATDFQLEELGTSISPTLGGLDANW
jgi:hypothetical protein